MFGVDVENAAECLLSDGIGDVKELEEDAVGKSAPDGAAPRRLLYPPAPRLAIFRNACAIESDRDSGEIPE